MSVLLVQESDNRHTPHQPTKKDVHVMGEYDDLSNPETLLTPAEVAALFRVNPKTVTRWARAGKLSAVRTLGGHRRFRASEIRACLDELSHEA
ncbi:hypothetical protein BH20ACT2_BH20ACT2_14920 [soil metagenome]